jgi:non-specific serine/threonine protein kinase
VRLLTLTGPGGVGKTRLALAVAAAAAAEAGGTRDGAPGSAPDGVPYPGGAWFVPLAALADPALLGAAVAGVLGVREAGHRSLAAALAAALRERRLLLVLDNCEHLLPGMLLVGDLLAACAGLTVLATSRAPLRLAGEHLLVVPPLSLPDPPSLGENPPAPEELLRYEAPALFVQRAAAAQAGFVLSDANAPAVAEVCRRLDGLPLAIELAAARVRLLPPPALLARLDRRLAVLTGGPRDAPARQQTLRATLDWSHDLLSETEQALFRRLAVFAGGCDLDAVEDVCGAAGDEGPESLEGLATLADMSLLDQTQGPDGESLSAPLPGSVAALPQPGRGPRIWLLETVHEFALERLAASGEEAPIRRAHARFYLALAEAGGRGLGGPHQAEWLARLETEHPNVRAALAWHLEQGDASAAARLAVALSPFWHLRSHVAEGRSWLARVLALGASRWRAEALLASARLTISMGDYQAALPLLEESLTLHRVAGARQGEATVLDALGWAEHYLADFERAFSHFQQSLALVRALGDSAGIAATLNNLGHAAWHVQDLGAAQGHLSESLALWRALGNEFEVGNVLWSLGLVAHDQGDLEGSRAAYAEGIAALQPVTEHRLITKLLDGLASVLVSTGEPVRAARVLGAADAWRLSSDSFDPLPYVYRRDFYDGLLADTHAALSEEDFATAWAAGQALPLGAAIAEALADAPFPSQRGSPAPAPRSC